MPSSDQAPRFTLDELRGRLDEIFYLDISTGRSYELLLDALSSLPRPKQDFALHWGKVAASTNLEIGYLVIELSPLALRTLSLPLAERWVIAALDDFDRRGQRPAVERLRGIDAFLYASTQPRVRLDDVEARLTRFVQGLSGRPLQVAAGDAAWTDTATIFLPPQIDVAAGVEHYMALAALLWGQTRYGTFSDGLEAALASCDDPARAAAWLALLEAWRVSFRVAGDLPGLAAAMAAVRAGLPAPLHEAGATLARREATVDDSLACLPNLMAVAPPADAALGALRAAVAQRVRGNRVAEEKIVLRRAVAGVLAGLGKTADEAAAATIQIAGAAAELHIDGVVVALPPQGRAAAQSLVQDLGLIPPECLAPAGPGDWVPTHRDGSGPVASLETQADAIYDEWDYRRRTYRRQWCHLYLRDLPPGDPDYVAAVRRRHAPLIRQIRRRFEALRGEDRLLRRQADGEEIDLDALVEAVADRRGGVEPDARLFSRKQRAARSFAALFMVDMSGSTKGWVNDAEREALVMLCEALETLGDRYAIWGFSGWTRTRCEVYRIKDFGEPYDAAVQGRIAAIEAKDYTRMGPPLRHLTRLLLAEPARHRLLVTLSDGRPDDFGDEYRGHYGVEDTRQALLEARQAGIRAFCVTIDRHGADYLKHMYGPASYTVLADVKELPVRIADIYRRLAS